ncbi:ankyrin repeat family protein [Artemisia annua]|uniref:Ankyrin repeat family protein n=1 Tax=Artemisia annua TaxID=35608 RepID=A0A2U1NRZ9_ARTAN|nr:ankyrin repeat family protein [Artemisia annua]
MASTSTSNKDLKEHLPLCRAIVKGNWNEIQELLKQDENALTAKLDTNHNRTLHLAIDTGGHPDVVKGLLELIDPNLLPDLVDTWGLNPLHHAALFGSTAAARMLVEKNPNLLFIYDSERCLPIHRALFNTHISTSEYLLKAYVENIQLCQREGYDNPFEGRNGAVLLHSAITEGFLDIASKLIQDYPEVAGQKYKGIKSPLWCITGNMNLYYCGARYNIFQRFVYNYVLTENHKLRNFGVVQDVENQNMCIHNVTRRIYVKLWNTVLHVLCIKNLEEDKLKHKTALKLLKRICEEVIERNNTDDIADIFANATVQATKKDNPEVIEELLGYFPLATVAKLNGYSIMQVATINRCEKVYNLLVHHMRLNMSLDKVLKDNNGDNLLHLAGKLGPVHKLNEVSGAALQMQRELQWFKEVEKLVQPMYREATNNSNETPMMVFRREHKELRREGEEWIKKTADSYTITTALIITIVFAAAITVPGGTDGDTGKAIYETKPSFIIFAISDAISLFTSTTSLLLFLSILTARYQEADFLFKLPNRLIFGLVMLYFSVISMIVAFSATLYIMFGQGKEWILIPIVALACLPIASFTALQFHLLVELISSTYGRGIFGKRLQEVK